MDEDDQKQSVGVPANGEMSDESFSPTGGPGIHHWQKAFITKPGLDDRGDVFFAAVEMTRMPMILTDPNLDDNPIVFANRAFQDLTGYAIEEIRGRNCRFLQGAHTNREQVDELRDAIRERHAIAVELLNYKKDGTPFWNAVYIAPVFDETGDLLYFFASQLDVTRRRTSEAAFRQAQKMESIGQLTAGLAHDFNNLLQVVQGNLELLRGKLTDDRLLRYVDRAAGAADRGAKLNKQLLAFARKTRLEPKAVDLNDLIHEFGEMLESSVGSRVELHFALKRRLPLTMLDPVHLEMALLNIVINARDATLDGGSISISTSVAEISADRALAHNIEPGPYVCLAVTDDGKGMPPHVLERATEPFYTTKETGKGTGLGLPMAFGFVQQSLGRLEIDSQEGRGTTVRMLFPVVDDGRPSRMAESTPQVEAPRPGGAPQTILLVEDNEEVLMLAREYLEAMHYRVVSAHSGAEALEKLADMKAKDELPDLLFSDIVMPGGVNGLVLAERAREMIPQLRVLLTTGYNEDLVSQGPVATGMDVLGKPYRRSELADRIRAALNAPPRQPATEPAEKILHPRHEG